MGKYGHDDRNLKKLVFERDGLRCQMCFRLGWPQVVRKCHEDAKTSGEEYGVQWTIGGKNYLTIDHIIPLSKGGGSCLSNFQTLCLQCNALKRNEEGKFVAPLLPPWIGQVSEQHLQQAEENLDLMESLSGNSGKGGLGDETGH